MAAGLLAALLTAGPAAATPDPGDAPAGREKVSKSDAAAARAAIAAGEIPGQDEIVHSANIEHLVNIPKDTLAGTNSDLAFQGRYAFAGNYDGFRIFDISNPRAPKTVAQVLCPGGQNDISVSGDLLFLSTDSSRSDNSCNSTTQPATEKSSWEGMKIFDISDKKNPKYVAAVETACGSHTHTLVPERRNVYVYVASYSPNAAFPDCQPPHDGISVIKVPRRAPEEAAVVNFPVLFPGEGPDGGGNPGSPTNPGVSKTTGCHDITVLPSKDLAAGACMGDGILFSIKDPENPEVIDRIQDNVNFAFWHSATFNEKANKVVFTDELGGGVGATCNEAIGPNRGADGVYDIVGKGDQRKLVFKSYFKIARHQADTENCVAHNGSLIPVKGKDIMVQAWYQGGVSVWDFTDSTKPKEIAYFERGPLSTGSLQVGGSWSAYYYNGYIYSNDIVKGLDVLKLDDRRTDPAKWVHLRELNVQTQPDYFGFHW
ncbi:LVIVD repeat-containing protein [Streptomyces graminofaciens]|uniref:LVIVD repeat-containing protein n=1 Tax=Streptomyces graminofaciens TaxID=68212 RepID=A0ABN5VDA6_9ACTN|nr:LVIVD repeat-containing protein [Streptomyces graminofaciens]